ncbi:MAG: hypothetical protein Q7Q73_06500 [Verrucomicrobiota bacterium JB024]|nr:hypothetical protein [Verrucomicrobiota bacterium JB024]
MKLSRPLTLVAAMSFALSAQAVTVSDFGANPPTENVEVSQTISNGAYQWRNNEASRRDLGQSFLAETDFTLDSFSFQANGNVQVGASGAAFTVTIYENNNRDAVGTAISTQTGTYLTSASNPVASNWLLFDLAENVDVTAGNYYTIMLSWNVASVTDQDQVFQIDSTGTSYLPGRLWEYNGTTFTPMGYDMAFTVQAIPEPSTMAYGLGAGVLIVSLFLKRRRNR